MNYLKKITERQPNEVQKHNILKQMKKKLCYRRETFVCLLFCCWSYWVLLWWCNFFLYLSFSFSSNAGYFNGRSESDELAELAIYADISPSGSCSIIGHFDTLLHFFRECLKTFCTFYMFSRNRATLLCLCCYKDAPSISLSGGEWNTYIARQ